MSDWNFNPLKFRTEIPAEISHVIDFRVQPGWKTACSEKKKKKNLNKNKIQNGRKNSVTKCRKSLKKTWKQFRWDNEEMISYLIQCILSYKPETEFEGKDFDHDKVSWYFQIFLLRDKYDKTLIFCFAWCNLRMLITP